MDEINRRAMSVPINKLADEIKEANMRKRELLALRDAKFGADRPKIGSYMENLTLPDLFGFHMRDYYMDPELAMEIDLRHKLFWLDNSQDDGLQSLDVQAGSMYYDTTLFGLKINYQRDGVPVFERHALEDDPDISVLKPFDFNLTGEMPMVHNRRLEFQRISNERYGGEVKVNFPKFHRGPLDIYIQLRGYENFISDTLEKPEYARRLLEYIVSERKRYNEQAARFIPAPAGEPESFVADDWLNVPFISPGIFDSFIAPAYQRIQENEGTVTGFHTCGVYIPLLDTILRIFPKIKNLDVNGWTDFTELDALVPRDMVFNISFINTFILFGSPEEHKEKFAGIKKLLSKRRIGLCASAIVKKIDSVDAAIISMNRFIGLMRESLSS